MLKKMSFFLHDYKFWRFKSQGQCNVAKCYLKNTNTHIILDEIQYVS